MASELSSLIEKELKNKGYYAEDDKVDEEEGAHEALMGALRVEVLDNKFLCSARPHACCYTCSTAPPTRISGLLCAAWSSMHISWMCKTWGPGFDKGRGGREQAGLLSRPLPLRTSQHPFSSTIMRTQLVQALN